jgi:MFS-type transporter involved in bile tolerance (Atg22 family)
MNQEDAFAEEAQEEIMVRTGTQQSDEDSKSQVRASTTEAGDEQDESSPLIPDRSTRPQRAPLARANDSYYRAINEPWTGSHGAGSLPWWKRPSIYWLLPGFFPFCIAFGGLIVPKQYLILDLICRDYLADQASQDPNFSFTPVILGGNNPQCRDPEVQALVAKFNLYANLLSGLFAAIVAPQLGALSDRHGRRTVMLAVSFGGFVMEIVTILVGTYPDSISVYWILLGNLIDGLCGSFTTGMALSFAYAADCTPPEERNKAFGFFHGTLFTGVAFGPLISGALMKATGTVMVAFYLALGCHVYFILFLSALVPESLSKERQMLAREKHQLAKSKTAKQSWWASLRAWNLFEPLWVLRPRGPGSSPALRRNLFLIAGIDTLMFGVAMGTINIVLIYAQYRFGWDEVAASLYVSAVNVCRVLALVVLLPLLIKWFRKQGNQEQGHRGADLLDIKIIRTSLVFDLIGYLGYALTPNGAIMVIAGLIASVGGIGSPTLQSSLTKHVPADLTGQVLGASALLHALARVVAPTIFNLLYSKTVKIYAGIVFCCLSFVFVVANVMSWFLKPGGKPHASPNTHPSLTSSQSTSRRYRTIQTRRKRSNITWSRPREDSRFCDMQVTG